MIRTGTILAILGLICDNQLIVLAVILSQNLLFPHFAFKYKAYWCWKKVAGEKSLVMT